MAMAGMVCTALSVSGQSITDLKTGYWLGSTPPVQEKVKFLGVIAASIAAALTIVLLARTFQFGEALPGDARAVLPSPQASIMKALVAGLHEPAAGGLHPVRRRRDGRPHHGDARRAVADLRAGHVPPARAEHAGAGRRLPRVLRREAVRAGGRRARRHDARARRDHRLRPDGGRRAGRRLRRGVPAVPLVRRGPVKTPFYDNAMASQLVSAALFVALCCYLWFGSVRRAKEEAAA